MKLHKRILSFVMATLIVVSCSNNERVKKPVNTGIRNKTLRTLNFHADTGFTPSEKTLINEVTNDIFEQSSGAIKVGVTYDLDFDRISSLIENENDNMIIRVPEYSPLVTFEDSNTSKLLGVVIGFDPNNYDPVRPKRIYIVAERLTKSDIFKHVTMHEMLHAFGLKHIDDVDSVMYSMVQTNKPTTCLNKSDANELCRVLECDPKTLNWCE